MMTPPDLDLEAKDVFLTPEPGVQLHAWFFSRPKPLATLTTIIPTSLGGDACFRQLAAFVAAVEDALEALMEGNKW